MVPPYQAPSSPEQAAREQERINLLLEINGDILEHANTMQLEGQGGITNQPATVPQMKQAGPEYARLLGTEPLVAEYMLT